MIGSKTRGTGAGHSHVWWSPTDCCCGNALLRFSRGRPRSLTAACTISWSPSSEAILLLLLLLITPLAYAPACDSTWIPGLYDVADYDDDAVLFLIDTAPAVGALAIRSAVFLSGHAQSQRPRNEVSRGPPPIEPRSLLFCAAPRPSISLDQHRSPHSLGRGPPLALLERIGPCQGSVLGRFIFNGRTRR